MGIVYLNKEDEPLDEPMKIGLITIRFSSHSPHELKRKGWGTMK